MSARFTSLYADDDPCVAADARCSLSVISPQLLLANRHGRIDHVGRYPVTVVISVLTQEERNTTIAYMPLLPSQVREHKVFLDDWPTKHFRTALDQVIQHLDTELAAGEVCMVHCMAGISRSPAVVMGYLMHSRGLTAQAAFWEVERARPCACPNANFLQRLYAYEQELNTRKV